MKPWLARSQHRAAGTNGSVNAGPKFWEAPCANEVSTCLDTAGCGVGNAFRFTPLTAALKALEWGHSSWLPELCRIPGGLWESARFPFRLGVFNSGFCMKSVLSGTAAELIPDPATSSERDPGPLHLSWGGDQIF